MGRNFRCLVEAEHEHEEQGTRSASVWRDPDGRLRYHCFRGHGGSQGWSLVHAFAYLATGDPSILAANRPGGWRTGGLGKGEYRAWAARAVFDLGFLPREGLGLCEPEGASETALRVWGGFVFLLEGQLLHDRTAVYEGLFTRNFAARWCGVSRGAVANALRDLEVRQFLHRSPHTEIAVYVVGPSAFPEWPHEIEFRRQVDNIHPGSLPPEGVGQVRPRA